MLQCRQASLCEQHTSLITRFVYFIGLVIASSRNKVSQIKIIGGKEREETVTKDWKLFFKLTLHKSQVTAKQMEPGGFSNGKHVQQGRQVYLLRRERLTGLG